jgi:Na+-transporting NADH:ubiquinone oxidoreductase subunit C
MAINTDKNSYTILFSVVMVAVVGSILALAATGLKDRIGENQRFEATKYPVRHGCKCKC